MNSLSASGSRAHRRRRALPSIAGTWLVLLVSLVACTGSGSDIGPSIPELPEATLRAVVRDNAGNGVAAARVEVVGAEAAGGVTTGSGAADLPIRPSGTGRLRVRPEAGAATDGDDLIGYTVAYDFDATPGQVPEVLYVADLAPSTGAAIVAGAQPSPALLDDRATPSGAVVRIPSGSVANAGATLRSGVLADEHLPGIVPPPGPAPLVVGRGVHLGPAGLTFASPGDLEVPNDLGAAAAAAVAVYRLDPDDGAWSQVGTGAVDGTGTRISANGVVDRTGLYVCAAPTPSGAGVVTGRVLDAAGEPRPSVLVRAPQARALTDAFGEFTLTLAAGDAAGQPRALDVVLTGGLSLLPRSGTTTVTPDATVPVDVGDLTLDTFPVGLFRSLVVFRGRAVPREPVAVANSATGYAATGVTGLDGRADFPEVPTGVGGFYAIDFDADAPTLLRATQIPLGIPVARAFNLRTFLGLEPLIVGSNGSSFVLTLDAIGGGPVEGVDVVADTGMGPMLVGQSPPSGSFLVGLGLDGTATTVHATTAPGGRDVIAAFSVRRPLLSRLEVPIEVARPVPLGAFEDHVLVRGTVQGIPAGADRRTARAARILSLRHWYDAVARGATSSDARVPVDVDPAATVGATDYALGVPQPEGLLVVTAGRDLGGAARLDALGFAEVRRTGAQLGALALDVATDLGLQTGGGIAFVGAGAGLDLAIDAADLTFDLGLVRSPFGTIVDAARDVGGNHVRAGDVLLLELGEPTALRAAGVVGQNVWIEGQGARAGGGTVRQGQFLAVDADGVPSFDPSGFLAPPQIVAPADGASLAAAAGVDAEWTVPPGADYLELVLRSGSPDAVLRTWTAVVPPDVTTFRFGDLPAEADDPLEPGNYELSVTAFEIGRGSVDETILPYQAVVTRQYGLHPGELGVTAISTATIALTLTP